MQTALASIFVFGLLVFGHELGHYAVARLCGVRILEFSMGMGPKLFGKLRKGTLYTIRLLPLGGFVRMAGMDEGEGQLLAPASDPGSFMNKKVWQRMAVIISGPLMNFILALLLFIAVFTIIGIPGAKNVNTIGDVLPNNPAAIAGIQKGDKILEINGEQTANWDSIARIIHGSKDQNIHLLVERNGQQSDYFITTRYDEQNKQSLIGISPQLTYVKKGVIEGAGTGLRNTYELTKLILVSMFQMITGKIPAELSGPVGIVNVIGQGAAEGIGNLLYLTGVLSLNLGLLNLFPIPALDGSRIVFLAVEGLRGRPLDPSKENMIHLVGFALLILLMVVITYKDVMQLLGLKT